MFAHDCPGQSWTDKDGKHIIDAVWLPLELGDHLRVQVEEFPLRQETIISLKARPLLYRTQCAGQTQADDVEGAHPLRS